MSRRMVIVIVVLAVLLIPFPTTVVPIWKVRVIDTASNPCPNREVQTSWGHYTINVFGGAFNSEERYTDDNGFVEFPRRTIWSPLIWRMIAPVFSFVFTLMHGGGGIHATIDTDDTADRSRAWISWRPGEPLTEQLVVVNCVRLSDPAR